MRRLLRVCVCWMLAMPVIAEQVVDLYQAEVLVSSQSSGERAQAAIDGLAEVVIRISGKQALDNPELQKALPRAQRYLNEYIYQSSEETLDVEGKPVTASRLVLKFSKTAVMQLLRRTGLAIWPENRPGVLVWLVQDDYQGRRFVGATDQPEMMNTLAQAARVRGLPLLSPVLDLEDQLALTVNDAWGMDEVALERASERYSADAILLGRISQTSRGWRASWLLMHRDRSVAFDGVDQLLDGIFAQSLSQVAEYLAALYAITPQLAGDQAMLMDVFNVEGFANYRKLLDYLEGLAMVRRVVPVSVQAESLRLKLFIEGQPRLLVDALAMDKRMTNINSDTASLPQRFTQPGSEEHPLQYQWRGR